MSILYHARTITIGVLAWSLLSSCGENQPQDQPTVERSFITATPTVTLNPSGSTEIKLPTKYLCIISSVPNSWPIDKAMAEWNKNGVNQFRYDSPSTLCKETVKIYLVEKKLARSWGEAEFSGLKVTISFNPETPPKHRQHVVCHELGHVFGIGHTKEKSCMNIDIFNPLPSPSDLATAAQEWQWSRVVNALQHETR